MIPQTAERRAGARFLPAALALLGIAGCTTGVVRPTGPVALVYGGTEGDERGYELEQVLRGRFAIQGVPQLAVVTVRAVLREKVERVAEDGRRLIRMTCEFSPPEINGMPMDTGEVPRGIETVFLRSPSGEVESLEAGAGAGGILDLAARSLGLLFPRLPAEPVEPGDSWERRRSVAAGTPGEIVVTMTESFRGMTADGGDALITAEGDIRMVEPESCTGLCRFELEFSGETRFSVSEGAPVSSEHSGLLKLKSRANDIHLEARMQFTSKLVRLPVGKTRHL